MKKSVSRRKCTFLLMALVAALCLSVSPALKAELAIVATRADAINGTSSIVVFNLDTTVRYQTPIDYTYQYTAMDNGTFQINPVTSQIIVTGYDPANDESVIKCYALTIDGSRLLFQTTRSYWNHVDIATAQLDDDDLDEYAIGATQMVDYQGAGLIPFGQVSLHDGTSMTAETPSYKYELKAIATGNMDDDPYDEICTAEFYDPLHETSYRQSKTRVIDHDAIAIQDSTDTDYCVFNDVVMCDFNGDGKDAPVVAMDWDQGPPIIVAGLRYFNQCPKPWDGTEVWNYAYDSVICPRLGCDDEDDKGMRVIKGQFDNDSRDELMIAIQGYDADYDGMSPVQEAESYYYDDDGSKIADNRNPWYWASEFNCLAAADVDGDGIDEAYIGHYYDRDAPANMSHLMYYDFSDGNGNHPLPDIDGWDYVYGHLTDMRIIDLPETPAEPNNCLGVWQKGYGMPTDLNSDCYVEWSDFSIFALQWLSEDCGATADFDGNCVVDWGDFAIFAASWLDCNDPQNIPPCLPNWIVPDH